ncbi:MAG TPA: tetratricopeptide repeat protein [Thermoanaerobaculia bacterium]
MMKTFALILFAALVIPAAAGAQEYPTAPYEFLMAKLAAAEGRYDEALTRLDRVISANPESPELRFERAMLLIEAGRMDRAESELRLVLKLSPEFVDASRVLGRIMLDRAGNDAKLVSDALVHLEAAFRGNPDDLSTGIAVSQIMMSLDRLEEAERILAMMVERAPDQRSLNFTYAQVLTKLGRGSETKQYLERTLAVDPTFGPAVMQLLDLYQAENEWDKAAQVLQPLVAGEPMNLELQRQQAYFYLRAGESRTASERFRALIAADPRDVRSRFYLAEALNDLGEYSDAEPLFRQLLEIDSNDADIVMSLAINLSGQKKWDEATQLFNRLLTIEGVPDNLLALARTQLAYIDLQKKNYDAAIATATPIFVFRDRPNSQAINIAIDALRKQEKAADVVALLAPLVRQFESDPFVNARYIEALARAGRKEEAEKHAALQVSVSPRNAVAAAEAWVQVENMPAAVELLEGAIAARPEEVDLRFQLGSVHERSGDYDAAAKVFLALLEAKPDHAPTLNYLGYMWADNNVNLDRAREMLVRAVAQEPANAAYVDSLGWVHYRLGNLEEAEKYLAEAASLMPRDPTIQEHLGDVLSKRGDFARALTVYRTALELGPPAEDAEKLREKIEEIESREQSTRK